LRSGATTESPFKSQATTFILVSADQGIDETERERGREIETDREGDIDRV
jgi:hypothetical protein